MVAEPLEDAVSADETVDAELGVAEAEAQALLAAGKLLSMESRGFEGRSRAGYALEKVLIFVGETALSVSSRKLAPFPKLRGVEVFTDSFGRGLQGIIGSEVVMSGAGAGDGSKDGGIERDIVDSIM